MQDGAHDRPEGYDIEQVANEHDAEVRPEEKPGDVGLAFRPDVEGLRAVAVVLVVLYHAGVARMRGGFVGVDVFFVISGYLITGLLLREHEQRGRISITGFYARRARRILPAAMAVVIVVVIAAYHYQNFVTYAQTAQDGTWSALFSANIHFAIVGTDYFAQGQAPSPLLHYWSLGVEEQFYLVWPSVLLLVGWLIRRRSLRIGVRGAAAVITAASLAWAIVETRWDPTWAYYSPLTRAWELGLGALAATAVTEASKLPPRLGVAFAWAGLISIAASALLYTDTTLFPGVAALLPALGCLGVIVGGASGRGASDLLGLRPVRAVGRVSYGWYLLHYPPMVLLAGSLWTGPLPVHERLEIAAATLAVSFVMYRALEMPIRSSAMLRKRPFVSISLGLGLVALAVLVCLLLKKSF